MKVNYSLMGQLCGTLVFNVHDLFDLKLMKKKLKFMGGKKRYGLLDHQLKPAKKRML